MSLYNALFGKNPFSGVLLQMLGTTEAGIPRFRDCYTNEEGSEIIIHTRTGGGNRDYYEHADRCRANYREYFGGNDPDPTGPWNSDLRKLPGFKYDEDGDFDSTYANFHYEVPTPFREQIALLKNLGAVADPAARWQELLSKLRAGNTADPQMQRALTVGESIFGMLNDAMKKDQKK